MLGAAEIDGAGLLDPVAPDAPAGPDLSYDPERQAIEQAFDDAEAPDWDRTIAAIEAQARQTRDLWLAVYLARAGAKAGDLDVVEAGGALLAGLTERFWDTVHPTIEDYGIEGRKGACESLVRIGEFLSPLRRIPLVSHPRLGQYAGIDFERFAAEGASAPGYGQFRAAVADTPVAQLEAVSDQLARIDASFRRVDAVLSDQAALAGQTGTNFQPTYEAIASMRAALSPFVGGDAPVVVETAATEASVVPALSPNTSGRIATRDDAARTLDAVIDYFQRHEPTSPVPVALARVKGWIAMDFMAILNDIAPGSLGEATSVLRTRVAEHDGSDMM